MAVRELPVARSRPTWTLVLTSLAFFMVALDTLVVVTALPAIQRDLHANLSLLEWTINAFTLAFAAGVITAAALGDPSGGAGSSPSALGCSRWRRRPARWRRQPGC